MAALSTPTVEAFFATAKPRLRRAFLGTLGPDRADEALSQAYEWAWANWSRISAMANPIGYLYRVGVTRSTPPKSPPSLRAPADVGIPEFEPRLVPAMFALPETQRTAVWLIHACGWSYADAASAMDIGESTVGTHASRGLAALRRDLKETP